MFGGCDANVVRVLNYHTLVVATDADRIFQHDRQLPLFQSSTFSLSTTHQVSVENATSADPSYPYTAGPSAQGLSWHITFPPAAGDASSLIVSTGNGPGSVPGSVLASAGTLSGADPFVTVVESRKGGLMTSMVTPEEAGLEVGTGYSVRVKAYNGIGWSEVNHWKRMQHQTQMSDINHRYRTSDAGTQHSSERHSFPPEHTNTSGAKVFFCGK